MSILGRFREALKIVRKSEAEEAMIRTLHDDPISVELIKRIARDYSYHFEIIQKDGTILRFFKDGIEPSKDATQGAYW